MVISDIELDKIRGKLNFALKILKKNKTSKADEDHLKEIIIELLLKFEEEKEKNV